MLFNFHEFIESLRENEEKKEVVKRYEKLVWKIWDDVKEELWCKDYVTKFQTLEVKAPDEINGEFDWDFLIQLVAASFSSEWLIDNKEEGIPELIITVHSGDKSVVKNLSELWWFQILRLYEIYIEEQMNLQILISESEKEKWVIESQRETNLERWNLVLENLKVKEMRKAENKEKKDQLDGLMDQL